LIFLAAGHNNPKRTCFLKNWRCVILKTCFLIHPVLSGEYKGAWTKFNSIKMKYFFSIVFAMALFTSCSKKGADNTSMVGVYKFAGSYTKWNDTVTASNLLLTYEFITTTSNHLGTLTISPDSISRKGLVYDISVTRIMKETNLTTGAVTITDLGTTGGQRGNIGDMLISRYSLPAATGKMYIENAGYLFSPEYLVMPADRLFPFIFDNGVLKIITEGWEPRHRTFNEATFIKQ
jgi:hypothetical protein